MARIGILALQGGFTAHARALLELGHLPVEVRSAGDLEELEGLILPGGESTTQLRLLNRHGLVKGLRDFIRAQRPVLATCAGLILLSNRVSQPDQQSLGGLDIAVARNAWGRQVDSFEAFADQPWEGLPLPLVFIRAPRVVKVGPRVKVLATFKREPILVQEGNTYGASFHPELTSDRRVHLAVFGSPKPPAKALHQTP